MTIILYNTHDENNRVAKRLGEGLTLNGTLRTSTDVLNPTITIEYDSFPNFNYACVVEFGRWYFITKITSVRNNLWALGLTVDVLMTYSESILNQEGFVIRSESDYSVTIPDPKFPVDCTSIVKYGNLWDPTDGVPLRRFDERIFNYSYALTVMADIDPKLVTDKVFNPEINGSLAYNTYTTNMCRTYLLKDYETVLQIVDIIQDPEQYALLDVLFGSDPSDAIISLKRYPVNLTDFINYYDLPTIEGVKTIKIFNSEISLSDNNDAKVVIGESKAKYLGSFSFKGIDPFSGGLTDWIWFTSYSPMAKLQVYLPYLGYFNIDPAVAFNAQEVYVYMSIDVLSGYATYYLTTDRVTDPSKSASVIFTACNDISSTIPIGRTNASEVLRNNLMKGINAIGTVALAVASGGASVPAQAASSAATTSTAVTVSSGAKSLIQSASSKSLAKSASRALGMANIPVNLDFPSNVDIPDTNLSREIRTFEHDFSRFTLAQSPNFINGGIGTWNSMVNYIDVGYYTISCPHTTLQNFEEFVKYLKQYGGMCCNNKVLRNIHGYTEVGSIHLENIVSNTYNANATNSELFDIESALKEGVILPYENE